MWECDGLQSIRCSIHPFHIYQFSAHSQMLGWAFDYHKTINAFVSRNKDLYALELSNTDWESINLVASWLKSFWSATTEMSATKVLVLSTTHNFSRITRWNQENSSQASQLGVTKNQTWSHGCTPKAQWLLLPIWCISFLHMGCVYVDYCLTEYTLTLFYYQC